MEYINSTGYVFTKVPNPNDIKKEIFNTKKDERMMELKNWLNQIN